MLKIYCIGEECYNFFVNMYPSCESILINSENSKLTSFCQYYSSQNPNIEGKNIWANITSYKLYSIHNELKQGNDVIFVDGDIVFNKNPIPYMLSNLKDNDLLVQNDDQSDLRPKMCTGFFYMKSTPYTIKISDFNKIIANIESFGNDQRYLRKYENTMKISYLPLDLFPNGKYWRENLPKECYIIHFNYDISEQKIKRMKNYDYWFMD